MTTLTNLPPYLALHHGSPSSLMESAPNSPASTCASPHIIYDLEDDHPASPSWLMGSPRSEDGDDEKSLLAPRRVEPTSWLASARTFFGSRQRLMIYSPDLTSPPPSPTPAEPAQRSIARRAIAFLVSLLILLPTIIMLVSTSQSDPFNTPLPHDAASLRAIYDDLSISTSLRARAFQEAIHLPPAEPLHNGTRVVPPEAEHTVTVIALHGLGGNPYYSPFPGRLEQALPGAKFVIPLGPARHISWDDEVLNGWYDMASVENLYFNEDVEGIVESLRQVHELVQRERALLVSQGKEPNIILTGFSQGAVIAMLAGLTANYDVQGVAPLSGYLALKHYWPLLGHLAPASQRLLITHGEEDGVVPVKLAVEAAELVTSPEFGMKNVQLRMYPGQVHEWTEEEMFDVGAFMAGQSLL